MMEFLYYVNAYIGMPERDWRTFNGENGKWKDVKLDYYECNFWFSLAIATYCNVLHEIDRNNFSI